MTTKLYTKDEIVEKAKEIAHMIANTEEVEFFKKAEEQINENQFVREKIASLKTLQKQNPPAISSIFQQISPAK